MALRQRRRVYEVYVKNLSTNVGEKEVSKKFTTFGEIQSITVKKGDANTNTAIVRFLCEPDANKAVKECHGLVWGNCIISVRRFDDKRRAQNFRNMPPPLSIPQQYSFGSWSHSNDLGAVGFVPDPCDGSPVPDMTTAISKYIAQVHMKNLNSLFEFPELRNRPSPEYVKQESSPRSDTREILCTYIEDGISFYGQCTSKLNDMHATSYHLQELCSSLTHLGKNPDFGKIYAAMYSADQLWYRCTVIKNTSPGKTLVRYIDYGNTEEVEISQISTLPDYMIHTPVFAQKCILANLIPHRGGKSSSDEAISFLQRLILGQKLTVSTRSPIDCPSCDVVKCIYDDQDVEQEIVKAGFALLNTTHLREQQLPQRYGSRYAGNTPIPQSAESQSRPFDRNSTSPSSNDKKTVKDNTEKKITILARESSSNQTNTVKTIETKILLSERDSLRKELAQQKERYQVLEKELEIRTSEQASCNSMQKLENTISSLRLLNKIRREGYQDDSCDIITRTFSVLREKSLDELEKTHEMPVENISSYCSALEKITQCVDKSLLGDLISKKNYEKEKLCVSLKQYLDFITRSSDGITVDMIQEMIAELKTKQKTSVDVSLGKIPSSIAELVNDYTTIKSAKKCMVGTVQKNTEGFHKNFMDAFAMLKKAFYLHPVATPHEENNDGKCLDEAMNLHSQQNMFRNFESSLIELQEALDAEINSNNTQTYSKNSGKISIIEHLVGELEAVIKRLQAQSQLFNNYSSLLTDITKVSSMEPQIIELNSVRKRVKLIKSKLRHKLADKTDIEEIDGNDSISMAVINSEIGVLQMDLHSTFVEEDKLLKQLADACKANFPELNIGHPELGLSKYSKYHGILKEGWELDHFSCESISTRLGVCFKSKFLDDPVIIKEFLLETEEKQRKFLHKIVQWNSIISSHLVPILAVFFKIERQMFVQIPSTPISLFEKKTPISFSDGCGILYGVLESLDSLHSHNLVHGAIHPSTVLLERQAVKLDFSFNNKYQNVTAECKGINFQAPELAKGNEPLQESDMYSFGCLIIWVLFPNFLFNTPSKSGLDVSSFQSIVEGHFSHEEYVMINSLLNSEPEKRPSAKSLLICNFLKSFDILASQLSKYSESFSSKNVDNLQLSNNDTTCTSSELNGSNSDNSVDTLAVKFGKVSVTKDHSKYDTLGGLCALREPILGKNGSIKHLQSIGTAELHCDTDSVEKRNILENPESGCNEAKNVACAL